MSKSPRFALRRLALAAAIASMPLAALAWGSQAGDNGQQPVGADNEGPRQAIPNETTNHPPIDYQAGTAYYTATTAYDRAMYYCEQKPLSLRDACRDAAAARYGYPDEGYAAQPAYVETYPGYMTYYYAQPDGPAYWRYNTYAASPEYYVYSPYSNTWVPNMNSTTRCAPLYGGGRADCLHGGAAGD